MADEGISRSRRKVQEQVERAEAEHRRQLLRRRIELANEGLQAFRNDKPVEAVRAFQTYIRILEDWKGVAEGSLNPSLFDLKRDAAELLLISGVYWDLTRLYDLTKTEGKKKEFLHYLEKFILFSKGLRHQPLCAETLRKHISLGKPRHLDDFKQAYKILQVNRCFVATELFDLLEPGTIPALRKFRDERLMLSGPGRAFVSCYYKVGPILARGLNGRSEKLRKGLARFLDALAARL